MRCVNDSSSGRSTYQCFVKTDLLESVRWCNGSTLVIAVGCFEGVLRQTNLYKMWIGEKERV